MKYSSSQSGFSLVETLVAITILLIVIAGPLAISSSVAKSTSFSSEQVVAFFLAQEGAELAQKARDDMLLDNFTNFAASPNGPQTAWDGTGGFVDSASPYADCFSTDGCSLENHKNNGELITPADCSNLSDCRLYYVDYNNNFPNSRTLYTYDEGVGDVVSPFTRVIKFVHDVDEVHVTSKVTWRTGDQRKEQEAVVETYLFNVYGN